MWSRCWLRSKVPLDGPGSHSWDLREMQAQRDRADRLEARVALAHAAGFREGVLAAAKRLELGQTSMSQEGAMRREWARTIRALAPAPAKEKT